MRLSSEILLMILQVSTLGILFVRLRRTGQGRQFALYLGLIILMLISQTGELVSLLSQPVNWGLLPQWHDLFNLAASLMLLGIATNAASFVRPFWKSEEQLAQQTRNLTTVLTNLHEGITLIDSDLVILAYNQPVLEMLDIPRKMLRKGVNLEEIFRFNAKRGEYGPGDVETLVRERVERAKRFEPHRFERTRPDGTVIEVRGEPIPGGGFVTTYRDITEQRRAENALKEQQHLLMEVLNNLPAPMSLKDRDLRYRIANKALANLFRVNLEDVIGKDNSEFSVNTTDKSIWILEADRKVLETGKRQELHGVVTSYPDGTRAIEDLIKVPFRNSEGEITGVLTISQNVSRRHEMEAKLREQQNLLSQIMDTLPSPVSLKDLEGHYLMVNESIALSTGKRKDQLIGLTVTDIHLRPAAQNEELARMDREVITTGNRQEIISHRFDRKDGHQIFEHITKVPFQNEQGEVIGVLTVAQDITALHQAQEDLRKQEHLLSQVLDTLPISVSLKNKAGQFLMVNEIYARSTGLTKDFLRGKHLEDIPEFSPQQISTILASDKQVLETGKRLELVPYRMKPENAPEQFVHFIKVPFLDERGETSGVLTVILDITQRHQAEEALRQSQLFLSQVMDTLPAPISLKDLEGRYLMVNRSIVESSGLSKDQLIGKKFDSLAIRPPDLTRELLRIDAEVVETGEQREWVSARTDPKTGFKIHEHRTKVPFRNDRGDIVGVLTVAQDITALHQAQEDLRRHQNLLTQVLDTLPISVSLKNREGRYTLVNQNLATLVGKKKEEVLNETVTSLNIRPREEVELIKGMDREVLESGERRDFQSYRHLSKSQRLVIERVIKVPFRDENGDISGIVTVTEDITARHEAEERLRESQMVLDAIMDSIPAPVALKDRERRYVVINKAMANTYGLPKGQVLGRTIQELPNQSEEKIRLIDDSDKKVLATGRNQVVETIHSTLPDGSTRVERVSKVPFHNQEGDTTGVVVVSQDITTLYRKEEALRRQANSLATLVRRLSTREGQADTWYLEVARTGSQTLDVERCGIWMFSPGHMELRAVCLFDNAASTSVEQPNIQQRDYPQYFRALVQEGPLAVEEAQQDPRTMELRDSY